MNPFSPDSGFQPLFSLHGFLSSRILFAVKQLPRTCVSGRVFVIIVKGIIVLLHPAIEIVRLAGVEFSGLCGAEDVHEEQICPP